MHVHGVRATIANVEAKIRVLILNCVTHLATTIEGGQKFRTIVQDGQTTMVLTPSILSCNIMDVSDWRK